MNDPVTYFITWTTYGTWLPGDRRGWRKANKGSQLPQPLLEEWCRARLSGEPVLLKGIQQEQVEAACHDHARIRGWVIHAVTADVDPKKARDQFKANATRVLRQEPDPVRNEKVWTRGGDCEIVDGDEHLERVVE